MLQFQFIIFQEKILISNSIAYFNGMNFFRNKNKITKISKGSLIITLKEETIQVSIYTPEENNLVLRADIEREV